jgi:MFS family permease
VRGVDETPRRPAGGIDLPGQITAIVALGAFTFAIIGSGDAGWAAASTLAALVVALATGTLFVAIEHRGAHPMLPLSLFRSRTFSGANAVSFFLYAGLFGALFLMSQFFQNALGESPLSAGLHLLPWTATPMLVAPVAGALADCYGNRPFMVLGLTLQALGFAWVASIAHPGMGYAQLGVALTVSGIGTSFCFPTVANAVLSAVPAAEAGVASGTNSALRELGGVFGVAVLASSLSATGAYQSPQVFTDGFTHALWIAAGFSTIGIVAALLATARRAHTPTVGADERMPNALAASRSQA